MNLTKDKILWVEFKDFDKYIETEMDLKVVKFNEFRKNIVKS